MKLKKQKNRSANYPIFKSYLISGITLGLATFALGCTSEKEVRKPGQIAAPRHYDSDGDGIGNKDDKCPNTPGSREYDGCEAPMKKGSMPAPRPHSKQPSTNDSENEFAPE